MNYSELYHHGIKGQKWGVRRFQNPDGSLTPEGRSHYGYTKEQADRKIEKIEKKKDRLQKAAEFGEGHVAYQWEKAKVKAVFNGVKGATLGTVGGWFISNGELYTAAMLGAGLGALTPAVALGSAAAGMLGQNLFNKYVRSKEKRYANKIQRIKNNIVEEA